MKRVAEELIDWIYPRRCAFCDGLLSRKEQYLCSTCRKNMPLSIQEPRCKKCGKPLEDSEREYCHDCAGGTQEYDWGRGIFLYQGSVKEALMRFKFSGRKEYRVFLGKLLCHYGKTMISQCRPEVILPVPVHKKRLYHRGYNQAQLLAEEVSKGFSIPIRTDLVLRKKFTKAQKELNREERKKNLEQAFVVRKEAGQYNSVLIIDDIYTTGATINAIAGKLRRCGVKKIYFLTVCVGKGM